MSVTEPRYEFRLRGSILDATWRPAAAALVCYAGSWVAYWAFAPLAVFFTVDVVLCATSYMRSRGKPITAEILAHSRRSWCSRGIAVAVWGDVARIYFRALGYKSWHILPDGFPRVLLTRDFWAGFFRPLY